MSDSPIPDDEQIEAYVRGRMTAADEERFEQYFFDHPEILDRIELAESLQRGIAQNAQQLSSTALKGSSGWFHSLTFVRAWAVAASVGTLALGVTMLAGKPGGQTAAPGIVIPIVDDTLRFNAAVRGEDAGSGAVLAVERKGFVIVTVPLENAVAPVRGVLTIAEGGATVSRFNADSLDGRNIVLALDTRRLTGDSYELSITGANDETEAFSFVLQESESAH